MHGDIGPDNVLLSGDEVIALVDFTPHRLPALLAASTALYWYHVYGRAPARAGRLLSSFGAMDAVRPWAGAELALWPAGLVWEAMRRVATPLELARREGSDPAESVRPRLAALQAVMRVLPELSVGL